jgi:hypothetical protein
LDSIFQINITSYLMMANIHLIDSSQNLLKIPIKISKV